MSLSLKFLTTIFSLTLLISGFFVFNRVEAVPLVTSDVSTLADFKTALANPEVGTINITGNILDIEERLIVNRPLTINNGGNFNLSFTDAINLLPYGSRHGILVSSDNVIINGLKITMIAKEEWQGAYGIQVYDATNVEIKDYTGTGADAALLINASSVTLTGITTVSGNEFGGIEVSKGAASGLSNSELTITGTITNGTESYGKPTVWLVNGQGTIVGAPTATNTTIVPTQIQYYLDANHQDKTSPVFEVYLNQTIESPLHQNIQVNFDLPVANDTVDADVDVVCIPASGSTFIFGDVKDVTCTATDNAGNTGSIIFSITLEDTTAPTATVSYSPSTPTKGNVIATITPNEIINDTVLTHEFTENNTNYTFNFTDQSGNPGSVEVSVSNIDRVAPGIYFSDYLKLPNKTNNDIIVTATTDSDATLNEYTHTFDVYGESFEFIATDAAGNVTKQTIKTENIDKITPVITLNGANPQTIEVDSPYVELGATMYDYLDPNTSVIIDSSDVDTSIIGSYEVTYSSTDSYGNKAKVVRTVNVVDITKPVIKINGQNIMRIYVGSTYIEEGATAIDNYDNGVSVIISGSVDTALIGVYTITYTATDASLNTETATKTINVVRIPSSGGGSVSVIPATPAQKIEGCKPGELFNTLTGKSCTIKAIPANSNNQNGQEKVLGAEKFNFTLLQKIGSQGNEVIELQKILNALGYDCGIADGHFGPITKAAVIKFQIANGLIGDGIVGALTRAILNK